MSTIHQTKEGDAMALEIKYNGKVIATLEKGQTATIPCDGKEMATDIVVSISALVNIITFTIAGKTYQSEDGMTWEQWVESSYNTDGYRLRIGHFVASSNGWYVIDEEGTLEFPTDTISNGVDYALQDPSN